MKTHLVFAVMTIALLVFVITQTEPTTLKFDSVIQQAEALSRKPFARPQPIQSEILRRTDYDGMRDIRYKDDRRLWRNDGLPFQAAFLIAGGSTASDPVTLFEVNRDSAKWIPYSADRFQIGQQVKLDPVELAKSDYSGFRLFYPLNKPDVLDEFIVFPGASYFRVLGRDQVWGISARGIAVDTLGHEQFPGFTTFWLVKPAAHANDVTVYALLDGPALTGAYEFRIAPGPETKVHVHAVLFPRKTVKDVGLALLTSMYWFGENTSNTFGDFRPEVHDSDGIQIRRSNEEWIWRPLAWAKQRQINEFADTNPKGFGLFQRDREFSHYQDLEANYHKRPSVWIEPDGDWGAGSVVLMQNPTRSEYDDNVVAYWRPAGGMTKGQRLEFGYTLATFSENAELPPLGRCVSTHIDYQNEEYYRVLFLDFQGGRLPDLPPDAKIEPVIWTDKNGRVSGARLQKNPNDNTWRLTFTVSTAQSRAPVEMRCTLLLDGKPVTETWTYTWVK